MNFNTELIYTGENFNLVCDTLENAKKAFDIAKRVLCSNNMDDKKLVLDEPNNKIYITEGKIGNENEVAYEICLTIANEINNAMFYGHAFFDDYCSSYESCADYEYENGVLNFTMIVSPEGNGVCPECEEQIVCFDEYNPNSEYKCEECGCRVENHTDMFFGTLPIVTKYRTNII